MTTRYRLFITEIADDEQRRRRDCENNAVLRLVRQAFGADACKYNLPTGAPAVDIPGRVAPIFSISHSARYAVLAEAIGAAAIGVDIEDFRPALRRVVPKFLNEDELNTYAIDDAALLRAWTLKEAGFKAADNPNFSLHDIHLPTNGSSTIRLSDNRTLRILCSTPFESRHLSIVIAD